MTIGSPWKGDRRVASEIALLFPEIALVEFDLVLPEQRDEFILVN
jgi:hypothetical protein